MALWLRVFCVTCHATDSGLLDESRIRLVRGELPRWRQLYDGRQLRYQCFACSQLALRAEDV